MTLSNLSTQITRRLPATLYFVAVLGGLALIAGLIRFNDLHQQFLEANFDSVHGARTLLKARHFLGMAGADLERAIENPARRGEHLAQASEALELAENYGSEGQDSSRSQRGELVARVRETRQLVDSLRNATDPGDNRAVAKAVDIVAALADSFESAELDRWGTLSSMNARLATRMRQLRVFLAAIIAGFMGLVVLLGVALVRLRRTEFDLRAAKSEVEAIQQTTLDAATVGIAFVGWQAGAPQERRVTHANQRMNEIFGAEPDGLIGLPICELHVDQENFQRSTREFLPALADGQVLHIELPMRKRNGEEFWCELSAKAVDPEDLPRGVVMSAEDISERKAAEARIQQSWERAEAASRAKSEFLANMSHEIRTPFTGILGVLELLQHSPLDDKQRHYVDLALGSTAQLLAIVNDVLDISRIEAGKLSIQSREFELGILFEDLAQVHATAAAARGIAFDAQIPVGLPQVRSDPVRLRQIADNLLNNAVKFTPEGSVGLAVFFEPINSGRCLLRVEVRDTGIGIPPEQQFRIFEKFTQGDSSTTRNFGGSGLGLSICRHLVDLLDGRIGLESRPGEGSQFWFELYLETVPGSSVRAACPLEREPRQVLQGVKLLLADDCDLNREVLGEQLRAAGCELIEAVSGSQAIELAHTTRPDLILMDCQMPGTDGYQATRAIRAAEDAGQHTPILAITACARDEDREKCLAAGMDDHIAKPVDREVLLARIGAWLAAARNPAGEAARPKAPPERFQGHVLVVDDDCYIREASKGLLEVLGCEVTLAESGRQALDAATEADFDLVLMDCHMPVMDGWQTARAWRVQEAGRLPTALVAVTADDPDLAISRCREAGMDDYLRKPFSRNSLSELLSRWL